MKILIFLLLALGGSAMAQDDPIRSCMLTKGSLSLGKEEVIFKSKGPTEHFKITSIPGLRVVNFQYSAITLSSGATKDTSILKVETQEGNSFEIVAGKSLDIYRVNLIQDHGGKSTFWKLPSQIK